MNRRAIQAGIGAGLVIAILGGVILFSQNRTKAPDAPLFAPFSMDATPLLITVLSDTNDAEPSDTTLRYDGSGTSELVSSNNGKTVRLIQTNDASYTCEEDDCTQLEGITSHPLFSPSDFIYSQDDIAALAQSITFESEGDCSEAKGTCSVWRSSAKQGQSIEIEVNTHSNQIVRLRGNSPAGGATLVYEYPSSVTIEVPTTK